MIPYDDLVVALTTWRARQGLPVSQMSGALSIPAPTAAMPVASPLAGFPAPGSGGARTSPPQPPRGAKGGVAESLGEPTQDESLDVDDAALLEEGHYENEGNDFAMAFPPGAARDESESTSIGSAPLRDSFGGATLLDSDLDGGQPPTAPKKSGW